MTDQPDDNVIMVPAHVFDAVAITVCRASLMFVNQGSDTSIGEEAAEEIERVAAKILRNVRLMLLAVVGPDREAYAQSIGWPSADALVEFLHGPMSGNVGSEGGEVIEFPVRRPDDDDEA